MNDLFRKPDFYLLIRCISRPFVVAVAFLLSSMGTLPSSAADGTAYGWVEGGLRRSVWALTFDPRDSRILYAGTGGGDPERDEYELSRSKDGGQTWTPLFGKLSTRIRAIAVTSKGTARIFTGDQLGDPPGIYASSDDGQTWSPIDTGLGVKFIQYLAIHPEDDRIIYAGTGWGVIKSEDGGDTWKHASNGLEGETGDYPWIYKIAFDPTDPEVVYVLVGGLMYFRPGSVSNLDSSGQGPPEDYRGLADVVPGLYRTTNGATSWERIRSNLDFSTLATMDIAIDPTDSNIFYLTTFGTGSGLYKTTNGGVTFQQLTGKLIRDRNVMSVSVDPVDPRIVYLGSDADGVWRSSDSGETWQQVFNYAPRSTVRASSVSSILIDPENHKRVTIGLRDIGVYSKTFQDDLKSEDFDEDGTIDFADFLLFAEHFGLTVNPLAIESRFDMSRNGEVDFEDFLIFAGGFADQN